MLDNLSLLLLAAAIMFFASAVFVGDRRGVRNALFLVACLTFVGFMASLAMNDALLNANVKTMTLGR